MKIKEEVKQEPVEVKVEPEEVKVKEEPVKSPVKSPIKSPKKSPEKVSPVKAEPEEDMSDDDVPLVSMHIQQHFNPAMTLTSQRGDIF